MRVMFTMVLLAMSISYGTSYYVSSTGNDNNTGTSSSAAWATISKVNGITISSGDKVFFEGGKIFSGTLILDANDGGANGNEAVVSSYGSGKATINGGTGNAISLSGSKYLKLTNLILSGSGLNFPDLYPNVTSPNTGSGLTITGNAQYITVDSLEVSGFKRAGITLGNNSYTVLNHCYAHDNGYAGISSDGTTNHLLLENSRVIHNPGDWTITNNHSGNGIVLLRTYNSSVEYCEAAQNGQKNGGPNGPVGMWYAMSDTVMIQFCVSHNNTSPSGDGGGFDFDGGCNNSIFQYNYAYENKNYGFQFCSWSGGPPLVNATCRYNISANNTEQEVTVWFVPTFKNIRIYNNTFYGTSTTVVNGRGADSSFKFWNNIFIKSGNANSFVSAITNNTVFQGNCYWDYNGGTNTWQDSYSDFNTWVNTTGHEKLNGQVIGKYVNPGLAANPANYPKLTDPKTLSTLVGFRVTSSSPCIDAGIDLHARFGVNVGTRDFFGNSVPQGSTFDIGAHEATSGSTHAIHSYCPSFRGLNEGTAKLYSINGKIVSQSYQQKSVAEDRQRLHNGIYLDVTSQNGTRTSKRIVVVK